MNKRRELITKAQFAEKLGVSPSNITRSIRNGRIQVVLDRYGREKIDWLREKDAFVATSTSPEVLRKFGRTNNLRREKKPKKLFYVKGKKPKDQLDELREKSIDDMSISDVRDLTSIVKARKALLAYDKERGKLVEMEMVLEILSDLAAEIRTRLTNFPSSLLPKLKGLSSEEQFDTCKREVDNILNLLIVDIKEKLAVKD